MADRRMAWAEVLQIICIETGLAKEDFTSPKLRKISSTLVGALELTRNSRDPNIFLKEWNNVSFTTEFYNRVNAVKNENYNKIKEDIDKTLVITSQKQLKGEKYFDGKSSVQICNGWITCGTYDGNSYNYYTRTQDNGVNKLKEYIISCLLERSDEEDMEFYEFLQDALNTEQEDFYIFKKNKGKETYVKGGL